MISITTTKNKENEKEDETIMTREDDVNVFNKNSRTLRSPLAPVRALNNNRTPRSPVVGGDQNAEERGRQVPPVEVIDVSTTPIISQEVRKSNLSPRQEWILKLQLEENEALNKCRRVMRKMKAATLRQKSIGNDVKEGISELEELLDIVDHCRKSWGKMEKEARQSRVFKATPISNIETVKETPTARPKRPASSPTVNVSGKKPREEEPGKWQKVSKKRKPQKPLEEAKKTKEKNPARQRREGRRGPKTEAVLIQPTEGHSYAEVLKNLRSNIQPDQAGNVCAIRKTRTGALLLDFGIGEKVQPEFMQQLKNTVQASGLIREIKPTVTVEIRDLDSLTVKEEVEKAVMKITNNPLEEINARVTAPNNREQVRAFVTLPIESAEELLKERVIKIGWTRARMRLCPSIKKCYRCLELGHMQMDCKGPDRSKLCFRCSEAGHKSNQCNKAPKCCMCVDAGRKPEDHMTGSYKCPAIKRNANR